MQPDTLSQGDTDPPFLEDDRVAVAAVDGAIGRVFLQVIPGHLLKFLLRQRVILVRHPYVVKDVSIAGGGCHHPARDLCVLVRVLVDQLELPRGGVVIDLEVVSGQLPGLDGHALDQPADLVVVRVERHLLVGHVVDADRLPLGFPLDGADGGQRAHPPGIDLLEDDLTLDNAVFGIPLQVSQWGGQAEVIGSVFGPLNVAGASLGVEPGEEPVVLLVPPAHAQQPAHGRTVGCVA